MITRWGMAPRDPAATPASFQAHWRTEHADAAGSIPGVRRYTQHHGVLVDGRPPLPYPGFDACSELDFDDLEAHDAGFASDHYQGAVRADEDRFVDKSRASWVLGTREELLDRGRPSDPVTLLSLWRAHPERGVDALVERAHRWAEVVAADDRVLGHARLTPRHDWHTARRPAACDLVDVLTFASVADALAHLAEPAHEAAMALAGAVFGSAHHLARPIDVVG